MPLFNEGIKTMKYTKPKLTTTVSALALVHMQSPPTKGGPFVDRAELQPIDPSSIVADPAACEADE